MVFKKPWFRFLVWTTSIFFFFISMGTLASLLSPPPNSEWVHAWMGGMMDAMMFSLMGIAMENHGELMGIADWSGKFIIVNTLLGFFIGLYWRIWRVKV